MKDLMQLDLYELLNITSTASESEIKKAYRKKALLCHPDKNPDPKADEEFKQLTKAVEILTNGCSRADYDKLFRQRKREKDAAMIYLREKALRKFAMEKEKAKRKQYMERREEEKRKRSAYKVPSWDSSPSSRFVHLNGFEWKKTTWSASTFYTYRKKKTESSFNFNFKPIVRPATFVVPEFAQFETLWKGSSKTASPSIVKPAKFVPSNSKKSYNSFGFCDANQKGSSPILKPATFVPPSRN